MSYPRIYSLSTAGILRHYKNDYLIHETRTDFTGSNGVGKSMIADFFQIIFVPYSNIIKFGTEGISKKRSLSNLPYEVSEAYIFLNIQVEQDRFITLGSCISKNKQRSPVPFLILNDVNPHKKLHELSFSENHIPLHSHFIKNGQFVALEDVAKHFRDEYQLYLSTYNTNEKKNEFFSFLYNQKILSINLSIEKDLKAFAKVIQSFSRAKSLDVNNSRSLKAFLFDDESKYDQAFRDHEEDLQTLLSDYRVLDGQIDALERKRLELSHLKELEDEFKGVKSEFFVLDYRFSHQKKTIAYSIYEKSESDLDYLNQSIQKLQLRAPKLQRIHDATKIRIDEYKSALVDLENYAKENEELIRIQNVINELIKARAPSITEKFDINKQLTRIDIAELEHTVVLKRIAEFIPVYQQYGSIAAMDAKYFEQYKTLEQKKRSLQEEIARIDGWINLFSSDKGLLARVLERGEGLSEAQESVLVHLLNVHWQKPGEVKEGERFTRSLQIFDPDNIEVDEDNNGFWLKLGHIKEFCPKSQEQFLSNPDTFKEALTNRLDSLKEILELAKRKIMEITQFEQGVISEISFLQLDLNFRDATSFNNLKQTALIIQNLGQRINLLRSQEKEKAVELHRLAVKIPFLVQTNNVSKQILSKRAILEEKEIFYKEILQIKAGEDANLQTLANSTLQYRERNLETYKQAWLDADYIYQEKESRRVKLMQPPIKTDDQEDILKDTVNKLEKALSIAEKKYQGKYRDISSRFEETHEDKNPEINEQIEEEKYAFSMLESVLLGPKIKHFDNLADTLRDSNRKRMDISHTIHLSMLKIFSETKEKFENYRGVIRGLNRFFSNRKISGKYVFHINFINSPDMDIAWIDGLEARLSSVHQPGGLPFGESVEVFVEEFFKQVSGYRHKANVYSLLDPKTYFDLSVSLRDENGKEYSGSTGEAYSAIVLLGIGRLSMVQKADREGLKFVILEETANLDQTNFNHFPEIAREFGYQIITMTPQPYGSSSEDGWYFYHLLQSVDYPDINAEPLGYFKTNGDHTDLKTYVKACERVQ